MSERSGLAERFYGNADRFTWIAATNQIDNPALLTAGQVLIIPDVGPKGSDGPTTGPGVAPHALLPYASEPFGVYQPLIGWRSTLQQERVAQGLAIRFDRAANHIRSVMAPVDGRPVPSLKQINAVDRTETGIGRALAAWASEEGIDADGWHTLLADSEDSVLTRITVQVLEDLQPPTGQAIMSFPVGVEAEQLERDRKVQISREAATASLLQHLGGTNPDAVAQLFKPSPQPWERDVAAVQFFAEMQAAKGSFLSPIGLLHRFREYFFELGTFLGRYP